MNIGETLQQARRARKLSLADVTRETKIQPWVLEALEANEVPERLSPVYVKGFLTTYARFLHLAPELLVTQLPWVKPEPVQQPLPPPAPRAATPIPQVIEVAPREVAPHVEAVSSQEDAAAPTTPPPAREWRLPTVSFPKVSVPKISVPKLSVPKIALSHLRRSLRWPSVPSLPSLPKLPSLPRMPRIPMPVLRRAAALGAVAAVVMSLVVVNPVKRWNLHASLPKLSWPKMTLPHMQAPKLASVTPINPNLMKPGALPTLTLVPAKPLELTVNANRTTWIQVRADGKLLTQQRLPRGANERWSAKKKFELVVANPSQVDLTLNDQPIGAFAIAHRGRLLITHYGVTQLPEAE